jgi:DUF4097 and DUF4098 domain-containing protein YvlB
MHYFEPSRAARSDWQSLRHDTLNFETCGVEPHIAEEITPTALAEIIPFPSATNSWITVNIHRKDSTMTDSPLDDESTTNERSSQHERVANFSPSGPVQARLSTQSGDVIVSASDSDQIVVTLRSSSPQNSYLLDTADVFFDAATNTLTVRTMPHGVSISSRGLRIGPPRSWFDSSSSDLDVGLELPRGSTLDVSTVSGDTSLFGSLGAITVKSVSGDVVARDTSEALEVQTASGDVISGHVLTTLKCKSSSGDVVCHGTAADTEIISASGDVVLSADQPGKIVVRNVSGDVVVRVARGLAVDINGNTVSGSLASNIDLDGDTDDTSSDEELVIKVTTVSGDIRIAKAS